MKRYWEADGIPLCQWLRTLVFFLRMTSGGDFMGFLSGADISIHLPELLSNKA